jgi:signal peptidase I
MSQSPSKSAETPTLGSTASEASAKPSTEAAAANSNSRPAASSNPARSSTEAAAPAASTTPIPPREETLLEQIVFAIVLAILIRGFVAEAFVIPTGSMAPTLMGRHKEITCPECGFVYAVNASDEVELPASYNASERMVEYGTCVNCRYQAKIGGEPSFKGDRILVMKFPYELPFLPGASKPKRWDVFVFHYPEEPEVDYIKRLIGLPGEDVRIYAGDVLTRPRGSNEPFQIERKPLFHQLAMQMPVYDDRYRPRDLAGPEWKRWTGDDEKAWTEPRPGALACSASHHWTELKYRNLVPDPEQWEAAKNKRPAPRPPRASLITDFYAYNTNLNASRREDRDWYQPHWVGDLTLSCRVKVESTSGSIAFRLVSGGVIHRCEIDLATGEARLTSGADVFETVAQTAFKGAGTHEVRFANVDGRLTLWVDGSLPFGDGWSYNDGARTAVAPSKLDLEPVGVAARSAKIQVSDLVITRDVYYTQFPNRSDYDELWDRAPGDAIEMLDALADPSRFQPLSNVKAHDYSISPGHYMAMGDNSPKSRDGRAWQTLDRFDPNYDPDGIGQGWDDQHRESWEVPENLLVGKAFFVYWPHAVPFGPKIPLSRDMVVPFRPYVERMKWIR